MSSQLSKHDSYPTLLLLPPLAAPLWWNCVKDGRRTLRGIGALAQEGGGIVTDSIYCPQIGAPGYLDSKVLLLCGVNTVHAWSLILPAR